MQDRSRRTREALIRATTELVAEVGYHRATTKAIATRAAVSEGTIYRHYPDKKALFAAALLAGRREVSEWMEQLPARAGSAPPVELLTETFTQLSHLRESVLPLEEASPEVLRPRRHLDRDQLARALDEAGGPPAHLAAWLAAEQRLGTLPAGIDPHRTAVMVLAAFLAVQTSPLAGPTGLGEADVRDFAELICHGLQRSPTTSGRRTDGGDAGPRADAD